MNKLLSVLLILVSAGFVYYYGSNQGWFANITAPEIVIEPSIVTPTTSVSVIPTSTPTMSIPTGWSTFTSEKYGFSISYPTKYKALTDKDNLYGWPKGIVLFYAGGQSYDLVIEYWATQSECEKKYVGHTNFVIKKIGDYYISLLNMNSTPEVEEIIETFRSI